MGTPCMGDEFWTVPLLFVMKSCYLFHMSYSLNSYSISVNNPNNASSI